MSISSRPHRRPTLARWALPALLTAFAISGACSSESGGDDSQDSGGRGGLAGTPSLGGGGMGGTDAGGTAGQNAAGSEASAGEAGALGSAGSSGASGGAPTSSEGGEAGSGGRVVEPPVREYPDVEFEYEPPERPPLTPDTTCGKGSIGAAPIPLDMYVVFDRSGTMNLPQSMPKSASDLGAGDCNVGDPTMSRWCYSINALDRFFGSEVAAGTGVALQFFPAGTCSQSPSPYLTACCASGSCCGGAAEGTPAVALDDLPQAREALVAALNEQVPSADTTPIEAALRGLIDHTKKARRPGRQMMGLLITDGGPEGCQNNVNTLAQLVRNHRAATGIPIYVVGTQGATFSALETIAAAGGAAAHRDYCTNGIRPCHFYNVGSGHPDGFIEVLQQIRRAAISCQFAMPKGESGLIDPNEIALSFTPNGEDASVRVNRVASSAACSNGGFYYDNNTSPRTITLCPRTCEAFREGDGGEVDILLGCKGS